MVTEVKEKKCEWVEHSNGNWTTDCGRRIVVKSSLRATGKIRSWVQGECRCGKTIEAVFNN